MVFATGMMTYGVYEVEEFLVKKDHLEWVGLESKKKFHARIVFLNQLRRYSRRIIRFL